MVTLIKRNATVDNTVALIQYVAEKNKNSFAVNSIKTDYKNLIDLLKGVFEQIQSKIRYKSDEFGKEQIKTPDRFFIKDKNGDCDDYTTFWSAFLRKFKIPHYLKVVKYSPNKSWEHIYVIVPFNNTYITLDNVIGVFNKEVKHVQSKLYK